MPRKREILLKTWTLHDSKATHNKALADSLSGQTTYWDWALTAFFYSALHKVEAYLTRRRGYERRSVDHYDLLHEVATDQQLQGIWTAYNFLYNEARSTRYDPAYVVPPEFISKAQAFVNSIASHIRPLL